MLGHATLNFTNSATIAHTEQKVGSHNNVWLVKEKKVWNELPDIDPNLTVWELPEGQLISERGSQCLELYKLPKEARTGPYKEQSVNSHFF